jgi:hypothetical protein
MKPRGIEWMMRGDEVLINAVFRFQMIGFHVIETSEECTKDNINLAICKTS